MSKAGGGNFFEDFSIGQTIHHATPRTLTVGDVALYTALYGSRFALQSSDPFAESLGLPRAPVDDLLVFHTVFGKTVPDISLNAIANLGYAECRFLQPVYPGDTLSAHSDVIGLRETSDGKNGIVYVRSTGVNQNGAEALTYVRWVMVRKRGANASGQANQTPRLAGALQAADLKAPEGIDLSEYDTTWSGSNARWDDYVVGERIDHRDGMTIEEAEHMLATRLYQNTARVHFNQFAEAKGRFGRRLIYGGHIISLARALSFNGLANAQWIAGINGGRHVAPCFAGDTIFAWTEIIGKEPLPGSSDLGALRLKTFATKDQPADSFPGVEQDGKHHPSVVLELDYWVLVPR